MSNHSYLSLPRVERLSRLGVRNQSFVRQRKRNSTGINFKEYIDSDGRDFGPVNVIDRKDLNLDYFVRRGRGVEDPQI